MSTVRSCESSRRNESGYLSLSNGGALRFLDRRARVSAKDVACSKVSLGHLLHLLDVAGMGWVQAGQRRLVERLKGSVQATEPWARVLARVGGGGNLVL